MPAKQIPQVVDLDQKEIDELLSQVRFGHLAMCRDHKPYVVPIHFAYDKPWIFFYTTEGLKTEIIDTNPIVCLQVEDISDATNWHSVIVSGTAERLGDEGEVESAVKTLQTVNPRLVPAWSIRWFDEWIRSNVEAVYRIHVESTTGRRAFTQTIIH
jgi:Predicted flavin-nucleotide-binding protein